MKFFQKNSDYIIYEHLGAKYDINFLKIFYTATMKKKYKNL